MNLLHNKQQGPKDFMQNLSLYTKIALSKYQQPLGMDMSELVFNLGSIVNPKTMLKLLGSNPEAKLNIFKTFNYLYKFSLERLQQFLANESLFLLLCAYLKANRFDRVHKSPNMRKYRHAYYEACTNMLMQS